MPESVDTAQPEKVAPTDTTESTTEAATQAVMTSGEELHPYTHRLTFTDLERPLLQITLMYLVRQGQEDEDTKLLELATQRVKLRGGILSVSEGFLLRDCTDAEQIGVVYNGLPQHERERVWNFVHDAEARSVNLDRQRDFAILEMFHSFLWEDLEASPADVMQWVGLTQDQYDLYKAAWHTLKDVYNQKWRLTNEEGEAA